MNFADRLLKAIEDKSNPSVVGLDPRIENIPEHLKHRNCKNDLESAAETFIDFNKRIIDAIYDIVPAVKLQLAFYEQYCHYGIMAFEETIRYARSKSLIVIADGKKNDIGSSAEAYASAFLGRVRTCSGASVPGFDVDALTVNPYLGKDSIEPFVTSCKEYNKGIFILSKTSNPSSVDIQDEKIDGKPVYERVGELINLWGEGTEGELGYRSVGVVVGATFRKQAERLRKIMPKCIFLVPGYRTQGAGPDDVAVCFNEDGRGAIVNASRSIIFAYIDMKLDPSKFDTAARISAINMRDEITSAIKHPTDKR